MTDGLLHNSLLAYLRSQTSRFHLQIMTVGALEQIPNTPLYPFRTCDTSSPFTAIVEGQVQTDEGHALLPVFLLIQKDHYPFQANDLQPIDNRVLEKAWQEVLSSAGQDKATQNDFLISGQRGPDGLMRPFRALFFCRLKERYFHPLCPACGGLIELCKDDRMLSTAGLKAYSSSLRRYLYCPACQQSGNPVVYYSFAIEPDDPGHVKDRFDLIKGFGRLKTRPVQDPSFPCPTCSCFSECYGPGQKVTQRIVAFSFYPFHLLIQKAASIMAADYLALLSGADFGQLQKNLMEKRRWGRLARVEDLSCRLAQATPLFFGGSDRLFAEILYLKLSFLEALAQWLIKSPQPFLTSFLGLSWDSIWIRLGEQPRGLPYLWGFDLAVIDPLQPLSSEFGLALQPPGGQIHFLAVSWFYVLLTNQRQEIFDVLRQVATYFAGPQDLQGSAEPSQATLAPAWMDDSRFGPQNLFWHPDAEKVSGRWIIFWKRALELGGRLLHGPLRDDVACRLTEHWLPDVRRLKDDVKQELFGFSSMERMDEQQAEGRSIAQIIRRIEEKWYPQPVGGMEDLQNKREPEDIVSRTVILAPGRQAAPTKDVSSAVKPNSGGLNGQQRAHGPQLAAGSEGGSKTADHRHCRQDSAPLASGSFKNIEETMILDSPVQPPGGRFDSAPAQHPMVTRTASSGRPPSLSDDGTLTGGHNESLEATLVLGSQSIGFDATLPRHDTGQNLQETLGYPQRGRLRSEKAGAEGSANDSAPPIGREDDDLQATVIIGPRQGKKP